MQIPRWLLSAALVLVVSSSAGAQVVRIEMTVTGAEMH
jgi:hypothetical protein